MYFRLLRNVACSASLAGLVGILTPHSLVAQYPPPGGGASISGTVGGRTYLQAFDTTARAKLEEYRDLRSGPVLMRLDLRWVPSSDKYGLWAGTSNTGQRDESFWFRSSRVGRFDFLARWDETPHTYSTTPHLIGTRVGDTAFSLPTPRQDTATINASPITAPLRNQWNVARLNLRLDPSPEWGMRAQYTRTRKDGQRPMGMAFGSPGNNAREIPEPIGATIHDFSVSQEVAVSKLRVQARYNLSSFQNDFSSVIADNQLVTANTRTAGSSIGRTALAPSNLAQSIGGTAVLTLPQRTRLTIVGSYGWRSQNQAFLPATINSAITNPALDSTPASLGGEVRTSLVQVSLTSSPIHAFSLAARYRYYDLSNQTPGMTVLAHVVNDRTLDTADATPEHFSYGRRNAGVDATLRIVPPLTLNLGWGLDQWIRDTALRMNVGKLSDNTLKSGANLKLFDLGTVRAIYSVSWRRSATPYFESDPGLMPELRMYDLAERDRHRFDIFGDISPINELTLEGSYGYWHDAYDRNGAYDSTSYGLKDENNWAAGGAAILALSDHLSLSVNYEREHSHVLQQARYRTGAQFNNLLFDWVGNTVDVMSTYGASFDAVVVPGTLSVGASVSLTDGTLSIGGLNPNGTPAGTGATATQIAQATAGDFPDVTYKLMPISAYVRFDPMRDWSLLARFTYEKYENQDFRNDGLHPATGTDLFLGNDLIPYNAYILTFGAAFRLGALGVGSASAIRP